MTKSGVPDYQTIKIWTKTEINRTKSGLQQGQNWNLLKKYKGYGNTLASLYGMTHTLSMGRHTHFQWDDWQFSFIYFLQYLFILNKEKN